MSDGALYVLLVAGVVVFAAFIVPIVAERIVRRDLDRDESGWLHAHEHHERKEPKPRGRARDERRGST